MNFTSSSALFLVVLICILVATFAAAAASSQNCPPRGLDTYDAFPIWNHDLVPTEAATRLRAQQLTQYNQRANDQLWSLIVLDEGWADLRNNATSYNWSLDAYGRPVPIEKNFPSSAGGKGLKPLADELKSKYGFSLGVWHCKGVPAYAVENKLPIFGTNFTADQIIMGKKFVCPWHKDMFDVDPSHPGGQAYYDSIVNLWTSWGLVYYKIDCIFGTDLRMPEIEAYALAKTRAEQKFNTELTLSLSPGFLATQKTVSPLYKYNIDLVRVTDDVWDCWSIEDFHLKSPLCFISNIVASTMTLVYFNKEMNTKNAFGRPLRPDPDMIAISWLNLDNEWSIYTAGMLRYIWGMWSITRSPLIVGGNLTRISEIPNAETKAATISLLSNKAIKDMHCDSTDPQVVDWNPMNVLEKKNNGSVVWKSTVTSAGGSGSNGFASYVGFFAFDVSPKANYKMSSRLITWAEMGLLHSYPEELNGEMRIPNVSTFDVFTQKVGPRFDPRTVPGIIFNATVNDAVVWCVSLNE